MGKLNASPDLLWFWWGIGQRIIVVVLGAENIGVRASRSIPNTSSRFKLILSVGRGCYESNVSIIGTIGDEEMQSR